MTTPAPSSHLPKTIFEPDDNSSASDREAWDDACWEQNISAFQVTASGRLITKAKTQLILDRPFFGRLALSLKFKADVGMDTCWVDGQTFGYNPKFIHECTVGQIKTIIAHEVLHCALGHHCRHRRGSRDSHYWNVSGDYIVNHILKQSNFEWIEGLYWDDKYDDQWGIEQVYKEIAVNMPPPPPGGEGDEEGGEGGGGNGGGNDGDTGGDENKQGQGPPSGEVRDGQQKDASQSKAEEQEWQIATAQAASSAKAVGKLSAAEKRFLDEVLPQPKMDWKEMLKQFMQSHIKNDYSFVPPNKRFIHMDMILPSLRGEALGEIVFGIDTSASLCTRELKLFGAECNEALETCAPEKAHVVYCDSSVCATESFTPDQYPIEFRPVGGGGTRFSPVYDWVKEQGIVPLCLVYFTDMYCWDYPDYDPGYPTLFVSTSPGMSDVNSSYAPPSHMNGVVVDMDVSSAHDY